MALHLAFDQIELVYLTDCALAVAHNLPITFHGAQAAVKQILFMRLNLQLTAQIFFINRHPFFRQQLQDKLPARQGVIVLFALTLYKRIELANIFFLIFH